MISTKTSPNHVDGLSYLQTQLLMLLTKPLLLLLSARPPS